MLDAAELALGRADAAREMPDRVDVRRLTGSTLDPTTLVETPTYATVHSDVPAIIVRTVDDAEREAGGETLATTTFAVHVPADVDDLREGDELVVTASGDTRRPVLYVENVAAGTLTFARRLTCRELGVGLADGDYPETS